MEQSNVSAYPIEGCIRSQSNRCLWSLWLALFFLLAVANPAHATPITPAGIRLATLFDQMDVEHHWLSHEPVDWQSGDYDPRSRQHATHCSAFAAAACQRAGVYLLCPPQHGQTFLASAQVAWLAQAGAAQGWQRVEGAAAAQDLANRGQIVVAGFANPDSHKPGHIAVVRPADKSADELAAKGPDIIQAGALNANRTDVQRGFRHHLGAFEHGQIVYYAHPPGF